MKSNGTSDSVVAHPLLDLHSVLVLFPLSSAFSTALSDKFNTIKLSFTESSSATIVLISGAIQVNSTFLDQYPDLKLVQTDSAGVNHINMEECLRRGIQVANEGEVYSIDVTDHSVGLLIDVLRRISAVDRYVRHRSWLAQGDFPLGYRV